MGKTKTRRNRERCPSLKFGWDDKVDALLALMRRQNNDTDRERTEARVYECDLCGRWHMTGQKKRRTNGR